MKTNIVALLSLLASASMACSVGPTETGHEEKLGKTAAAFTGYIPIDVTTTTNYKNVAYNVTAPTNTFLSGFWGNLNASSEEAYAEAAIGAGPTSTLTLSPGATGNTMRAAAWAIYPGNTNGQTGIGCVSTTATSPVTNQIPTPSGSNWRCFLWEVSNDTASGWTAWGDSASISYNAGKAYITCTGNAAAIAGCAPVTTYLGSVSQGSTASDLSTSLGNVDWTNNKICLLTAMNGYFRSNVTSDGVGVRAIIDTTPSPNIWYFKTSQNQGGAVDCVE